VITVEVDLGERSYPVVVGEGALGRLDELLPPGIRRLAIITQQAIPVDIRTALPATVLHIGQGEEHKNLQTVERLCSELARHGFNRSDCVVGVGGGMVTDVAGFTASVFHRGLPVVHVATTLLAQIDAAVGGKTGVNLPEGKNLVGTFWQPAAVICDTSLLSSLPEREWRCGLGELAKYHWLGGGRLDELPLPERIAACVRLKAQVVSADEREGGRRALLNYGHTLGHALEIAGGHALAHGEAVAIGLVFAAELAHLLGRIDADAVAEHRRVVGGYGLPTSLPAGIQAEELVDLMRRDKKALSGLTFVLDGPNGVEVVTGVGEDEVRAALDRVRDGSRPGGSGHAPR
jgi:5-deoxy-5-amino-3-dehydroquinate synthase